MAMFDYRCPYCRQVISLEDNAVIAECPKCGLRMAAVGDEGLVPNGTAGVGAILAEIGTRGNLRLVEARRVAKSMLGTVRSISKDVPISLAIGGYEHDQRELWDIVEAREYLLYFAQRFQQIGGVLDRFTDDSQKLIRACQERAAGRPVQSIKPQETMH